MKKLLTLILLLSGFSCFAQTGVMVLDSIQSSGVYRKFYLYIPASYNSANAFPLVFDLHDLAASPQSQQGNSGFMLIADTADFLLVNPQGTGASPYWNAGLSGGATQDLQFISDLIDTLKTNYAINNNRVYCCGFGNGGIMSYYLSCGLSGKVAAVASVAGTMYGNWFNTCKPNRAVPVMEIHGTQDASIPYEGSPLYVPVDTVIRKWVVHNKCAAIPASVTITDSNTSDNSTAVNYRYTGGTDNSAVELFKITGGSHSWPGSLPVVANTNLDFSASAEIWRFFRQFDLSQFTTQVGLKEQAANTVRVHPNPAAGQLTVDGLNEADFFITSADGRIIAQGSMNGFVDVSDLSPGIYFISLLTNGDLHRCKFIRD
jgi:polyhydroxybutyrate depolymerase